MANNPVRKLSGPVFGESKPEAPEASFKTKHASDAAAYKTLDQLARERKVQPLPFPAPRGGAEPRLGLADVLGGDIRAVQQLAANGQIVFHAAGDIGATKGPMSEEAVAGKMGADFREAEPSSVPAFAFLLGDIVYSFGESQYYYDQFYEPFRDYPAPILAVAGNHDGMPSPLGNAKTLAAFLDNFCAEGFRVSPDAGGLTRTAQVQPGVFFSFDAPFVRIIALYSNALEDPGVISGPAIGDSQLKFLRAALARVTEERYQGALIFALHHPPYSTPNPRGWSVEMLQQLDQACTATGVWPHAVLAGHAHNYQRFTRTRPDGSQIPYIVCGNGGHGLQVLSKGSALRTPLVVQAAGDARDQVVLENYDDQDYGYLRVVANGRQLRVEYHPASDGNAAKTPDDHVTVDLASHQLAHFDAAGAATAPAQSIRTAAGTKAKPRTKAPRKPRNYKK
jgi:hypothetical protein